MSGDYIGESLKEKRNIIIGRAEDVVINQVSNILLRIKGKVSQKAWRKLLNIAEGLDKDGTYKLPHHINPTTGENK